MSRSPTIAVSGPGGDVDGALIALAREVGSLLARDGACVVTGGLDGVMAAAAHGAIQAGGQTVGLLPGEDADAGSEHLSVRIATGLGQARNAVLVNAVDGLIAIGGSWGTLSEIAFAMRAGKPVVCLRGWTLADSAGRPLPLLTAETASEAVGLIQHALRWQPET
jgi:uncharacterized protein (TIGR00725 family)